MEQSKGDSILTSLGLNVSTTSRAAIGRRAKAKGADAERVVADLLGAWTGTTFKRVPRSGGFGSKAINMIGDVTPEDLSFNLAFTIEVKFYKALSKEPEFIGDSLGKRNIMYSFFLQSCKDALKVGKKPLLFVRRNSMPKKLYYVLMDTSMFVAIQKVSAIPYSTGYCNDTTGKKVAVCCVRSTDLMAIDFVSLKNIFVNS